MKNARNEKQFEDASLDLVRFVADFLKNENVLEFEARLLERVLSFSYGTINNKTAEPQFPGIELIDREIRSLVSLVVFFQLRPCFFAPASPGYCPYLPYPQPMVTTAKETSTATCPCPCLMPTVARATCPIWLPTTPHIHTWTAATTRSDCESWITMCNNQTSQESAG